MLFLEMGRASTIDKWPTAMWRDLNQNHSTIYTRGNLNGAETKYKSNLVIIMYVYVCMYVCISRPLRHIYVFMCSMYVYVCMYA